MNATEPLPVPLTRAEMYRLVDVLRDAGEITLAKSHQGPPGATSSSPTAAIPATPIPQARRLTAQPPLKPCMASGGRQQEKAYPTMTTTTPARACPVCEVYAAQTVPDSNWHAHHLMIHAHQHPATLDQAGRRAS